MASAAVRKHFQTGLGHLFQTRHLVRGIAVCFALVVIHLSLIAVNAQSSPQKARERVDGVPNFGRVTDLYFRGGEVTALGVEKLAALGVKIIIDLRDDPDPDEAEACKRLGLTYYNFPLSHYETPDAATIDKILQLIRESNSPVYVHCSGGKHRAGTICALYRMKVQGRSPEQAWREQQAYGFGPPEEHPKLFLFAYGNTPVAKRLKQEQPDLSAKPKPTMTVETSGAEKPKPGAQVSTASGSPKKPDAVSAATEVAAYAPAGALSATARYILPADAVQSAKASGASGELVRINLEYDKKRSVPVWKVIFSSATEYRFNALSGELLATKAKPAEGMSVLSPLILDRKFLSFQAIIAKAEQRTGQRVSEMELKRVRGRDKTFFEVALEDGVTLFFDAVRGKQIIEF